MRYFIIVDYSAVEEFSQERRHLDEWQGLFNSRMVNDQIIFTANESEDLDQCKDFWGKKLVIESGIRENIQVQFIVQKSLADGIRTRVETVTKRPQDNRFVFFGKFSDKVITDLKGKYEQDLGKRLVIFDNIAADQFDVFFGDLKDDCGITFGCSKFDEFVYFFNIPAVRQFKKHAIQILKAHTDNCLDFSGIIAGPEGGYNFSFSVRDMQEMMAAIPSCVKSLNLGTALMGLTSNNVMTVLEKIPLTVEEFDASCNDQRLRPKISEFFKTKEGEQWVFLRQTYKEPSSHPMNHQALGKPVATTMAGNKKIGKNTGLSNVVESKSDSTKGLLIAQQEKTIKDQQRELDALKIKVTELTQELTAVKKENNKLSAALDDERQNNSKSSGLNRQTSVPTTKREQEVFYETTKDEDLNKMLKFICRAVNESIAEKKEDTKSGQYSKQSSLPERTTDAVSFFNSLVEEERKPSPHGSTVCQLKK